MIAAGPAGHPLNPPWQSFAENAGKGVFLIRMQHLLDPVAARWPVAKGAHAAGIRLLTELSQAGDPRYNRAYFLLK